jgi:amino acid permease
VGAAAWMTSIGDSKTGKVNPVGASLRVASPTPAVVQPNFDELLETNESGPPTTDVAPSTVVGDQPLEEVEQEEEEREVRPGMRTSRLTTIMMCLSSMLGVGILAIPSAFSNTGIITSIVLILFIAAISSASMLILIILARKNKTRTFPDLVQKLLGRRLATVFSIVDLISIICAAAGYLITGADMLVSWFAFAGLKIDGILYRAILVGVYSVVILVVFAILHCIIPFVGCILYITVLCESFYFGTMSYKALAIYLEIGISPTIRKNRLNLDLFSSLALFSLFFGFPSSILSTIRV